MSKELKALKRIKRISLTHFGYDVDENMDGELVHEPIEVDDGTIEENYPEEIKIIETALKRIDYLERVNKDLQESKDRLIEERNNKIIEHRAVYDNYNFQSIKKFVACKSCQYYEDDKCSNTSGCFWLDLEKKLKAFEIIKEKRVNVLMFVCYANSGKNGFKMYNQAMENEEWRLTQEEFDLLKEVLL